jgi:hypothetical protein
MTHSSKQFDRSFAYAFNWKQPEVDLDKALAIMSLSECGRDACLAGHPDYHEVCWQLANHPDCPPPVLAHLAQCAHPAILERIAGNPGTAAHTLDQLSVHQLEEVRLAVAENLNASIEALHRLSADPHADVRFRLAENHNIPQTILEILAADDNPYVACRAQTTLDRLVQSGQIPKSLPAGESEKKDASNF